MCQKSSLEILSRSKHGYVGVCNGCGKYNLVFENLFLLLTKTEFLALSRVIDENYGVWSLEKSIGNKKKIIMQTPLPNMYFAFTADEYAVLTQLINQAVLLLDARDLLIQPLNQN